MLRKSSGRAVTRYQNFQSVSLVSLVCIAERMYVLGHGGGIHAKKWRLRYSNVLGSLLWKKRHWERLLMNGLCVMNKSTSDRICQLKVRFLPLFPFFSVIPQTFFEFLRFSWFQKHYWILVHLERMRQSVLPIPTTRFVAWCIFCVLSCLLVPAQHSHFYEFSNVLFGTRDCSTWPRDMICTISLCDWEFPFFCSDHIL